MLKRVRQQRIIIQSGVYLAMITEKQTAHLSKLLSYILSHKPGEYGIVLDENGYTNVDELISNV